MSEEKRKEEIQKQVISKWAKVSFVCGISVWAIFVFFVFFTGLFSILEVYTNWEIAGAIYTGLGLFSIFVPVALSFVSLISGIACLVIIKSRKKVFKGTGFSIVGILSSLLYLVMMFTTLAFALMKHMNMER